MHEDQHLPLSEGLANKATEGSSYRRTMTRPRTIPVDWALAEADALRIELGYDSDDTEHGWQVRSEGWHVSFYRFGRETFRLRLQRSDLDERRINAVIAESSHPGWAEYDEDAEQLETLRHLFADLFGLTSVRIKEGNPMSLGRSAEREVLAELAFEVEGGLLVDDERTIGLVPGDFGVIVGWLATSWEGHRPHRQLCEPIHLPFFSREELGAAIDRARSSYARSLATCDLCGRRFGAGETHDIRQQTVCHGCAERHLGVVH